MTLVIRYCSVNAFFYASLAVKLKYITDCKCRILKTGVYRSVLASFSNGYLRTATRLLGLLLKHNLINNLIAVKKNL